MYTSFSSPPFSEEVFPALPFIYDPSGYCYIHLHVTSSQTHTNHFRKLMQHFNNSGVICLGLRYHVLELTYVSPESTKEGSRNNRCIGFLTVLLHCCIVDFNVELYIYSNFKLPRAMSGWKDSIKIPKYNKIKNLYQSITPRKTETHCTISDCFD